MKCLLFLSCHFELNFLSYYVYHARYIVSYIIPIYIYDNSRRIFLPSSSVFMVTKVTLKTLRFCCCSCDVDSFFCAQDIFKTIIIVNYNLL